jgi:hypothetical protein
MSAEVERVFSSARRLVTANRNRLQDTTIENAEQERLAEHSRLEFRNYAAKGGALSLSEWQESAEKAMAIQREQEAYEQQESIARKQADRLSITKSGRQLQEAFVKLFNTSRIGFNITNAQKGRRDTSPQSNMRKEMRQKYCGGNGGAVWEPALYCWGDLFHAAHLFPWCCADTMDTIFGEGSQSELFSAVNGLFLHHRIEDALEKGVIAIVPDVDLEPQEILIPSQDTEERQQRVRDWEQQEPKN